MLYILYFILLIGPLVFFHELGHFLFAKLFRVKVLRFSLGFGPAIPGLRRTWGETEYQVAYFPLGGYVKMLGDDPTEPVSDADRDRAFGSASLWKRYIIVAAGPVFNLILPVLIFFFGFLGHDQAMPSSVGTVVQGTPAHQAGLQPGDRIVEVNGHPTRYWRDMVDLIKSRPNQATPFVIMRNGKRHKLSITPALHKDVSRLLSVTSRVGRIGIRPEYTLAQVGLSDKRSSAWRAGIRTGDIVAAVNQEPVTTFHDLREALKRASGKPIRLSVLRQSRSAFGFADLRELAPTDFDITPAPARALLRATPTASATLTAAASADASSTASADASSTASADASSTPPKNTAAKNTVEIAPEPWERYGLQPAEMYVDRVDPASPAAVAGLRPGDRVFGVDGRTVTSWGLLAETLFATPKEAHTIRWITGDGQRRRASVTLKIVERTDEWKHTRKIPVFGAYNRVAMKLPTPLYVPWGDRVRYAAVEAPKRTWEISRVMVVGIVQIVRRRIPLDNIGGPIMLGYVAKTAAHQGWETFILIMALISINLALINLLPIPVLDGGHILIFSVEAIRRKPITLETRGAITWVGLVFILLLMSLAFMNDCNRYIVPYFGG